MDIKLQIVLFAVLATMLLVIFFWVWKTETRLKKFFFGRKSKDLEDVVLELREQVQKLSANGKDLEKEIGVIKQKMKKSIRGLETIRFNPFPDQGGNQSFAIGMLDEEGNGVVLSSLYSRDRMSIFAKPIKGGKSQYELTEEEKEALEKSKV